KKQESLLQADLAKAERAYSASRTQGADTLSTALFRLANNCLQQGRSAEAESLLRRCLQVGADEGKKPSALELHWLGLACMKQGKFQESEQSLRQALAAQEEWGKDSQVDPGSDSALSGILSSLGSACLEQKKFSEAESIFRRNLANVKGGKDGGSPVFLPSALGDLAWLYTRSERYAEAEPLFAQAVLLRANAHALEAQAIICDHYAECLRRQGKTAAASGMTAR